MIYSVKRHVNQIITFDETRTRSHGITSETGPELQKTTTKTTEGPTKAMTSDRIT